MFLGVVAEASGICLLAALIVPSSSGEQLELSVQTLVIIEDLSRDATGNWSSEERSDKSFFIFPNESLKLLYLREKLLKFCLPDLMSRGGF